MHCIILQFKITGSTKYQVDPYINISLLVINWTILMCDLNPNSFRGFLTIFSTILREI